MRFESKRQKFFKRLGFSGGFLCICIGVAIFTFYGIWACTFDISTLDQMPQLAEIYDTNGNLYSRLHGENRIVVPFKQISPLFIKALLAREDTRFYQHHGVDPRGIVRAVVRNVVRRHIGEGASTLTQQLARNSLSLGGRTWNRKILEAFVALRIEHRYTKEQILEFYINRIYYGSGVYGLETASEAYFNKPCSKLDLSEAAMMAGLIRSPSRFSPLVNSKAARRERDVVLDRMVALKFITPLEARNAKREPIQTAGRRSTLRFQDNYAVDAINRELRTLLDEDQLSSGRLKIYTTLDPTLETESVDALENHLKKIENRSDFEHPKKEDFHPFVDGTDKTASINYLQGAVVVIENKTGAIKALVGGRDYKQSHFNRAISAQRQVGSAFKPFVFATAFEKGLLPGAAINDGPIQDSELANEPHWNPANSDRKYGGVMPAEVGLIRSRNTMSIRVGELAGLEDVIKKAAQLGLNNHIPFYPTVYLGAFETDLRTLTSAYTVFPNNGVLHHPYFIERIDDADGQILYVAQHEEEQPVLKPGVAWLVSTILEKVVQTGTAGQAQALGFNKPAGGKTGTTNFYKDAWFIGYTTSLTCGVWVGMDNNSSIKEGGYGATLALPIWCQVMNKADANTYPALPFKSPEPLQRARLCSFSNQLATQGCIETGTEYEMNLPVSLIPQTSAGDPAYCAVHQGEQIPIGIVDAEGHIPGTRFPKKQSLPGKVFRSLGRLFGGRN